MKNLDIQQKSKNNKKQHIEKKYTIIGETYNLEFVSFDNGNIVYKCKKHNKNFEISGQLISLRIKKNQDICLLCNKVNSESFDERNLFEFIKNNYNKEILIGDRTILQGKELDIYLPDLKLAFEFNGLYWHSELYKDKDYHLNKTEECLKNDIQLIHIYEDDWNSKNNIVKSRILNLLGKSKILYARKCIIKEISSCNSKKFLDNNHIQGNVNSKYRIGLYYENKLVSLMTFGNSRFEKNTIEMLRFCNNCGISVVGGASKLFKYFIEKYKISKVISYADRSWSIGCLYDNLGFKLLKETLPNYRYIIGGIRENRFKYRKSELIKDDYNKNKTEKEIMFERGIYRIYDSGNLKYVYDI